MVITNFDVSWAYVVFPEDPDTGKSRPILIINNKPKSVRFLNITSKYKHKPLDIRKNYYPIHDWCRIGGLTKPSWIDTNHSYEILKPLPHFKKTGHLSSRDIIGLLKFEHLI